MRSTDHNLNNPLHVDNIEMLRAYDSTKCPTVEFMTAGQFDKLETKDPYVQYVVDYGTCHKMYLGDTMVYADMNVLRYSVGTSKDAQEFIIYLTCIPFGNDHSAYMVEIERFDNPKDAIDELIRFQNAGSHYHVDLEIYETLMCYINNEITLNDCIIGIMKANDHKYDVWIQNIIQTYTSYKIACTNVGDSEKDIPAQLRDELPRFAERNPNSYFPIYSKLYNVIVGYDFFKADKYHKDDHPNLSDEITALKSAFVTKHAVVN